MHEGRGISLQQTSVFSNTDVRTSNVVFIGALREGVLQFICTGGTYVHRYGTRNLSRCRVRFSRQENEPNPGYIISAVERLIFRSRSGDMAQLTPNPLGMLAQGRIVWTENHSAALFTDDIWPVLTLLLEVFLLAYF